MLASRCFHCRSDFPFQSRASCRPEHISVRAAASGENYVLNGTKLLVPDAHVANYLLVVARTR